jgi:hypothetical protein
MRNGFVASIAALIAMLALSTVAVGQAGAPNAQTTTAKAFDPHDLSGYWDMRSPSGTLNTVGNNRPPMTAWGKAKFSKVKTGLDGKQLSAGVYPERKDWNDPVLWCDPPGFPRIMWLPTPPGMRFVPMGDEVLQFFEYGRTWRDIWTDGRKLSEDAEPRWYGYSTGKWEGNTFVVTSTGFMDSSWLDQYGSPHSDEMRIEERYRRVDRDHLELVMTVYDSKAYTAPWVGDPKMFVLADGASRSNYKDLGEDICVWSKVGFKPNNK